MPRNFISFTKEGYENVIKEHAALQEERKEAVLLLKRYREMGDLSENAAYSAAKRKLGQIDGRLRHLARLIKFGKIVETSTDVVGIGCKVTVESEGEERTFNVVGGYESDPMTGKVSTYSPIGKALNGKRIGDVVIAHAPVGEMKYKILKIE